MYAVLLRRSHESMATFLLGTTSGLSRQAFVTGWASQGPEPRGRTGIWIWNFAYWLGNGGVAETPVSGRGMVAEETGESVPLFYFLRAKARNEMERRSTGLLLYYPHYIGTPPTYPPYHPHV